MLITSGTSHCFPSCHTHYAILQRHVSYVPSSSERNTGWFGIPLLSTPCVALLCYFAYMVLGYKMLLPNRRDTEQKRLKERNFVKDDHLLAGLEKSLPRARSKVLESVSCTISKLSGCSENFIPLSADLKKCSHITQNKISAL